MSAERDGTEVELLHGKVIGRRRSGPLAIEQSDRLLATAAALRGTPGLVPRGLYRFTSFEEADAWMRQMIARTHARHSSRTSSGCAKR